MVQYSLANNFRILGFIDDGVTVGTVINGFEVLGNIEWLNDYNKSVCAVIAIGNPQIKYKVINSIHNSNIEYPNLVHPNARIHNVDELSMGKGNIITDGCILTTNIGLGDFNLLNLSCTIGHDTAIGDYCSIMPGTNISGGTKLKNRVFIGTGVNIIKEAVIGDNSIIGAGAVVNRDVPAGKTYVGIPAKELKNDG